MAHGKDGGLDLPTPECLRIFVHGGELPYAAHGEAEVLLDEFDDAPSSVTSNGGTAALQQIDVRDARLQPLNGEHGTQARSVIRCQDQAHKEPYDDDQPRQITMNVLSCAHTVKRIDQGTKVAAKFRFGGNSPWTKRLAKESQIETLSCLDRP